MGLDRRHTTKPEFTAKVRNQGSRPIYVDTIGFTASQRRFPAQFTPYSSRPDKEAREVPPGRFEIFLFFGVRITAEDAALIDGMYVVTGTGHLFTTQPIDMSRIKSKWKPFKKAR
jgi:hypothetical protein